MTLAVCGQDSSWLVRLEIYAMETEITRLETGAAGGEMLKEFVMYGDCKKKKGQDCWISWMLCTTRWPINAASAISLEPDNHAICGIVFNRSRRPHQKNFSIGLCKSGCSAAETVQMCGRKV